MSVTTSLAALGAVEAGRRDGSTRDVASDRCDCGSIACAECGAEPESVSLGASWCFGLRRGTACVTLEVGRRERALYDGIGRIECVDHGRLVRLSRHVLDVVSDQTLSPSSIWASAHLPLGWKAYGNSAQLRTGWQRGGDRTCELALQQAAMALGLRIEEALGSGLTDLSTDDVRRSAAAFRAVERAWLLADESGFDDESWMHLWRLKTEIAATISQPTRRRTAPRRSALPRNYTLAKAEAAATFFARVRRITRGLQERAARGGVLSDRDAPCNASRLRPVLRARQSGGRPRATSRATSRSSARSGDSGGDGPGESEPPGLASGGSSLHLWPSPWGPVSSRLYRVLLGDRQVRR